MNKSCLRLSIKAHFGRITAAHSIENIQLFRSQSSIHQRKVPFTKDILFLLKRNHVCLPAAEFFCEVPHRRRHQSTNFQKISLTMPRNVHFFKIKMNFNKKDCNTPCIINIWHHHKICVMMTTECVYVCITITGA